MKCIKSKFKAAHSSVLSNETKIILKSFFKNFLHFYEIFLKLLSQYISQVKNYKVHTNSEGHKNIKKSPKVVVLEI